MKTGYILMFRSGARIWLSSIHYTKREAELTHEACEGGLKASFADGYAIAECMFDDPAWERFVGQVPENESLVESPRVEPVESNENT